jgi:mRNA interferase RelE/StbE
MGKYRIEIKKSAAKEIEKLPGNEIKKVLNKIKELSQNPRPIGCKKLSKEEKYRIRQGNYRILYQVKDDLLIIFVVKVAHRKDVYRR